MLLLCNGHYGRLHSSLKASHSVFTSHKVTNSDARICTLYISEFIMSEKKMGSFIILVQAALHTPTLLSSKGNSHMILELSAESDIFDII